MFRFVLILLFSITLLDASSAQDALNKAETLSQSSKNSNIFKSYNEYKNLYLRSVSSSDNTLKIKALEGIVNTGEKLKIDVTRYSDELKSFEKIASKNKSKVILTSVLSVESVRWDEDTLVLNFDKEIDAKQINYFTIHDTKHNRFRYIFDIHSAVLKKNQSLSKNGIGKIKLNQYDTQTIRLVVENQEKLNISHEVQGNDIRIDFGDKSTATVKELFKSDKKEQVQTKKELEKSSAKDEDDEPLPADLKKFSKSSRVKTIVIDPGHGGKDSGAIGYKNLYEKNIVLSVAQNVAGILTKRGYKVYMTRNNDTFVELKERTAMANKKDADLFISIHANAVASNCEASYGIETYFLSPSRSDRATRVSAMENSTEISEMSGYGRSTFLKFTTNLNRIASNKLAIDVQKGLLGNLKKSYQGVVDSGVREGPFWVLVGAQMPAILVEIGFITNPEEAQRLADPDYEEKMAYGIANGVDRYFINN
jgi:N-acetylmuramoyl-L-alanine amidase